VELLPGVVWTSQLAPEQRLRILRDEVLVQSVTLAHFFVAQTITHQYCHFWGFFTRSGVFLFHLGFWAFLENLGLFDSGQSLEMYVVLRYFQFINTVLS